MTELQLIKRTARPLYDRAIDALNELVASGRYQPGDRLPPESELAENLGISRSTLREAVGYLECRGVIYRRHGVGIFVAQPASHERQRGLDEAESFRSLSTKVGVRYDRTSWSISVLPSDPETAARLNLYPGEPVVQVGMAVTLNGRPYAYLDGFLPSGWVDLEDLRNYTAGSIMDYLIERTGADLTHTYTKITAVIADAEIAAHMSVSAGIPLVYLSETYQTQDGIPVLFSRNYFDTSVLNFFIVRRIVRS